MVYDNSASGVIIASGTIPVQNSFAIEIVGSIAYGSISDSSALIYCPAGANVSWVEKRG